MEFLAINLIKLRNWVGITQKQLAENLDVGITTINNIESGYVTAPPAKLIEKIASLFNTTVDGLLGKSSLEIGERARLVYVVSSIDAKTALIDKSKIVDGIFMDRDRLRGHDWVGLKIKDNALAGEGILSGYTAIVKMNANVKNNDVVVVAVEESDEAIVRIYQKRGDIVTLKVKNDSGFYKDITLDLRKDSLKIIGKVEKCEFDL